MSKRLDITGQKFYKLLAIKDVTEIYNPYTKKHYSMWLFKCDCGKEKIIEGTYVKRGKTQSCGCSQGPKKLPFGIGPLNNLIANIRLGAKRRKHQFKLSREEIIDIINQNCYYCGIKPSNKYKTKNSYYLYNGIDRVNNDKGYIKDNVVACCKTCNFMKLSSSKKDFLDHVDKIYKHQHKAEWNEDIKIVEEE
jgi:hypothetical protein